MTRRRLVISASCAALLIAVGAVWFLTSDNPEDPADSGFPMTASATYNDGSSTTTFKNVGEMVATAAFAVEGKVLRVEQGEPVQLSDGSGDEIVPRILVVEVSNVFHRRNLASKVPSTLRITDGYWEDGVGYERESIGWATPGQVGFFLLSRDRGPDGTLLSTYSPLDGSGIALIENGKVEYSHHGVWRRALGESASPTEIRDVIKRGASDAQSGAVDPVPVTICFPSVPGDENSEPICVEE